MRFILALFNLFSANFDIFLQKTKKGLKIARRILLIITAVLTVIFPKVKYHARKPTETAVII